MRMILCALSICLTFEPYHLAGAQAAAVAELTAGAGLEARRPPPAGAGLVRAHHLRDLLRLLEVIDLGGKIEPPQRHAEQEPQPGHDAVAVTDARARLGQVQLEPADVVEAWLSQASA